MIEDDLTGVPLRRVPRQARSREKVERALLAAEEIAERDGLDALNLTRVAAEAGLSAGSVHQYLPDRGAIVSALVARYHERIEARMDAVIAEAGARVADDPVGVALGEIASVYREETATRLVRSGGGAADDDARRAHKRRMVRKVQTLLRATGAVDDDSPVVARVVFTAADAVMHDAFAGSAEPDAALLSELETLLRAYLSARPSAGDLGGETATSRGGARHPSR